ncbi:core-2/I-branching enzyme-domain-containing protein [Polychytrium aggregatum]|uniref:core-2/I-branching enzyme-domain-containing protein n=1 Tax=Polychytrium aggregatum TaxID=110093 RepID=UPI0022FE8C55|nr:core-2/I-branching enzyme-domain-containing protein [Polychytrium aggregatum]KAI9207406.1 core-2/I-branching enzyme-domain-containing protein [Polychytrium aggregatum]
MRTRLTPLGQRVLSIGALVLIIWAVFLIRASSLDRSSSDFHKGCTGGDCWPSQESGHDRIQEQPVPLFPPLPSSSRPAPDSSNDGSRPEELVHKSPGSAELQPIFDEDTARVLREAERRHIFVARGFKFCSMLDGASFDGMAYLRPFNGSVADTTPTMKEFCNLIDTKAQELYNYVRAHYHNVFPSDGKRLACYSAAEGSNTIVNFSQKPLLLSINPIHYFKPVIPALVPHESVIPGPRRKYKIAYLLMVHEISGFIQLKSLIDKLDDGDSITLIHIDARSKELRSKVQAWLASRPGGLKEGNVFIAQYSFKNVWGHISLVFTQLSGFYELLDLADWDYVINLSNYDWPLARNEVIHKTLRDDAMKHRIKDANWIEYWPETDDLAERLFRPHVAFGDDNWAYIGHPKEFGIVSWPFSHWKAYKHHQWMILNPHTVRHFRTNLDAFNLLAYMEHSYIPDESYFATTMVNAIEFNSTIIKDMKRYLAFEEGSPHPTWLSYTDRQHLNPNPLYFYSNFTGFTYFFCRKFNALDSTKNQKKLLDWIDSNLFDPSNNSPCEPDQISFRRHCLLQALSKIAVNNQVIVIPTNKAFVKIALNLACSLARQGLYNIVFWSLDIQAHDTLLDKGYVSLFDFPDYATKRRVYRQDYDLVRMMRNKPKVLAKLVGAGFDVWFLDGDSVVLRDLTALHTTANPTADVYIALGEKKNVGHVKLSSGLSHKLPVLNVGTMFLRGNARTYRFLLQAWNALKDDGAAPDLQGFTKVLGMENEVVWVDDRLTLRNGTTLPPAGNDLKERDASPEQESTEASLLLTPATLPPLKSLADRTRFTFLAQEEFVNGYLLFGSEANARKGDKSLASGSPPTANQVHDTAGYSIIHADWVPEPEIALRNRQLWFLGPKDQCLAKPDSKTDGRGSL